MLTQLLWSVVQRMIQLWLQKALWIDLRCYLPSHLTKTTIATSITQHCARATSIWVKQKGKAFWTLQSTLLTKTFLSCKCLSWKLVSKSFLTILAVPGEKQSSMVIIFSCWKTMIGTAVVSLPWAFQQSGIILGFPISCSRAWSFCCQFPAHSD